tara:strand:+ start:12596 stop:13213 length:618 start_codon:yes stop_codon:yes gene_type:complete
MTPEERAKLFARYESKRKSTSSKGTGSSQGAPPPPAGDAKVEVEVEEEVEPGFTDFTVAESVSQVPDPVALQQNREAVAQGLFSRLGSSIDRAVAYEPEPVRDIRFDPETRAERREMRPVSAIPKALAGGAQAALEPVEDVAFAAKEAITQPVTSDLPTPYIGREIERLEAEKMRLQQKIDDLRGEAARRTGVQEDKLRFQGMEP